MEVPGKDFCDASLLYIACWIRARPISAWTSGNLLLKGLLYYFLIHALVTAFASFVCK